MLEPLVVETTVDTPIDAAFDAFVLNIDAWWPMDPFSMSKGLLSLDPTIGGAVVETAADGTRFVWGHVTAFEKPTLGELAWHVGSTVDTATQIRVTCYALEDGTTQVRLVQSGWEALGDKAAQIRGQNEGGWRTILGTHFAQYVAHRPEETTHV